MKGKELNEIQIINLLLQYGRLKLTGTAGNSITEKFHAGPGQETDTDGFKPPVNVKTIKRQVKELCEEGLLQRDEQGWYSICESYFVTENTLNHDEWKKMLNILLENHELNAYRQIRNYVGGNYKNILLDNAELEKYADTVQEPVHFLSKNQDAIKNINRALAEGRYIRVAYKGKEYKLYPLCYVLSRDGTRKYLYSLRRKKLSFPMELSALEFMEFLEKAEIDKKTYIGQIRDAWDIDVQSPDTVRLFVKKGKKEGAEAVRKLGHVLGRPVKDTKTYCIFEGDIIGMNDFKTWLRSYMDVCFVLQPENLREEFVSALQEKEQRYRGIK